MLPRVPVLSAQHQPALGEQPQRNGYAGDHDDCRFLHGHVRSHEAQDGRACEAGAGHTQNRAAAEPRGKRGEQVKRPSHGIGPEDAQERPCPRDKRCGQRRIAGQVYVDHDDSRHQAGKRSHESSVELWPARSGEVEHREDGESYGRAAEHAALRRVVHCEFLPHEERGHNPSPGDGHAHAGGYECEPRKAPGHSGIVRTA